MDTFQEFWSKRTSLVKQLASGDNVSPELLKLNSEEKRLVNILSERWGTQRKDMMTTSELLSEELKSRYKKIIELADQWVSVIGVHKNFLDVESRIIPSFTSSKDARKEYFKSLETSLQVYSQIVSKSNDNKTIGKEIVELANKKLSS
jgi:AAA+ ATPase superfamily predicted ATPase